MTRFVRDSESIWIEGRRPLGGRRQVQGSKNAALPILAACMLIPGKCVLKGCPDITDIKCMCNLLQSTGAKVEICGMKTGNQITIDTRNVREHRLDRKSVV